MTTRTKRIARVLGGLVGLVVVATALIGFAHTRAGRPLRPLLGLIERAVPSSAARCPLGYDVQATPAQRAAGRRRFAATHAGDSLAAARPALGFTLDGTSRSDIQVWAAAHGIHCAPPRSGADLECTAVPAAALPVEYGSVGIQTLWLTFGPHDELVQLRAIRYAAEAAPVSDAYAALMRTVTESAGPPATVLGEPSASSLARGALSQASAEYRFKNYYAIARATNTGRSGYALTEEYRSLPN